MSTFSLLASFGMRAIHAQTARVSGVVRDSAGMPLQNAEVAIVQLLKSTRTDKNGEYRVEKIPYGTQLLTAKDWDLRSRTIR